MARSEREQTREPLLDRVGKARKAQRRRTQQKDDNRRRGEQLSNPAVVALPRIAAQKARQKYTTVKQKLHQAQIPYAILYPDRLRVTYKGKDQILVNLQQAQDFL
ncbi:hypothetical protein NDU88_002064 [Pleurodeles waltl]|uniref:Uncharacterized protein n=1 Tax=Pleurodeles waltl TaxID=8319 RepID=A0AAV7M2W4_PLEWA|nr:hypothetical protein NDU88_002064 [Pleurodeles waltl]